MASAPAKAPAARAPVARTPRVLQRPRLSAAAAAEQWAKATRAIERHKALRDQAAPVLLEHFQRTNTSTYKGIAREPTGGSLVLDQPKVKAFLGAQLAKFQKRTERGWTLKLIK